MRRIVAPLPLIVMSLVMLGSPLGPSVVLLTAEQNVGSPSR